MKKVLIYLLIFFLQFATGNFSFSQTGIGLDCNQPIDNTTGAIYNNATAPIVATTCTQWVRLNFILGPWTSPSDQTLHSGKTWKQTYDEIVNGFIQQGIQVYGLIGAQSVSQQIDDMMIAFPGTDSAGAAGWKDEYVANFVEVVDYFKDRVTVYESYNEPNNWDNGSTSVVHPGWFALLLQEIYLNVKYFNGHWTDPAWQVSLVSGAILTLDVTTGGQFINDTYWYGKNTWAWDWTFQQTGSYPLDGIGMHLYVEQGSSNPTTVSNAMNYNLNDFWNNVISYEGTTSKQLWISEFGWESANVEYQGQADNLTTAFNLLKNDSRIALALWFTLSDWPGATWGIYELGNFAAADQKLSFTAFQNQVSCPAVVPFNLIVADSFCNDSAITFSWNNSGTGWYLDISADSNFTNFYNKSIDSLTSTACPMGFCDYPNCTQTLVLQSNTTYYWRIWNGSAHTYGQYFTIPAALSIAISSTNVLCNGGNDGSATANVSGGISPYTYLWSNSEQTQNIDSLQAGNYFLTVTDGNGVHRF